MEDVDVDCGREDGMLNVVGEGRRRSEMGLMDCSVQSNRERPSLLFLSSPSPTLLFVSR